MFNTFTSSFASYSSSTTVTTLNLVVFCEVKKTQAAWVTQLFFSGRKILNKRLKVMDQSLHLQVSPFTDCLVLAAIWWHIVVSHIFKITLSPPTHFIFWFTDEMVTLIILTLPPLAGRTHSETYSRIFKKKSNWGLQPNPSSPGQMTVN